MKQHYGDDFTRNFRQAADGKARPDEVITITNDPRLTPEKLRSLGYRLKGTVGRTPQWVHPTGKEVWILPPPTAAGPPPLPPTTPYPPIQPPTHPDVQAAQQKANDLEARHDALWEEAERLKALKSPDGTFPAGPFNEYYRKLSQWEKDLKEAMEEDAPEWRSAPLTDQEKQTLEQQLKRLEDVKQDEDQLEDIPAS
jgi:hypothetical protein